MAKALCVAGSVVALLLFLMFGFDITVGFPFEKASPVMDIGFLVCSLILAYISWATLMEQK